MAKIADQCYFLQYVELQLLRILGEIFFVSFFALIFKAHEQKGP